jgi:hypothetical protein
MQHEGPQLEVLTHRLGECPAEFLLPPLGMLSGVINVAALVADHFRAIGIAIPTVSLPRDARQLSHISLATWLLGDEWFADRPELATPAERLFGAGFANLASVVTAEQCVRDPDRREEFARTCLAALSLRPKGETIEQASDRLAALDSVARVRVLRDTRASEARARQVREQMARRAAQEAAAKTTRE